MTNTRKLRWIAALLGIVLCLAVWLVKANAQSSNQLYVSSSSCSAIGIMWNDKPADNLPTGGGVTQLFCPWGSYTWTAPLYQWNLDTDYYYISRPVSLTDTPKSGNNWDQCLIGGYLVYTINSIQYHKNIEYPTGYDGYLDCQLKSLPMIMHYGPRSYQTDYEPYPGPMQGMSAPVEQQQKAKQGSKSGNPYP